MENIYSAQEPAERCFHGHPRIEGRLPPCPYLLRTPDISALCSTDGARNSVCTFFRVPKIVVLQQKKQEGNAILLTGTGGRVWRHRRPGPGVGLYVPLLALIP